MPIYSNTELRATKWKAKDGTIVPGLSLGESGKRSHEIFLPIPAEVRLVKGLRKDLSIVPSRTGKPKIVYKRDDAFYMLLSSEYEDTSHGCGHIYALIDGSQQVVARGNGVSGGSRHRGRWITAVVKAHEGDAFRIVWSGHYYYAKPDSFYIIRNGEVFEIDENHLADSAIELPFEYYYDFGALVLNKNEWAEI